MTISSSVFREHGDEADRHFAVLAGRQAENFRGGLLKEYRDGQDPEAAARRIVEDLDTSASPEIAAAKVHLLRAAVTLEDSEDRRVELLRRIRGAVRDSGGAMGRAFEFAATTAHGSVQLPGMVQGTNAQLPNRPLPGWEKENEQAVHATLNALSAAGALFTDRLPSGGNPRTVAMKIELNMGIDGPPSVSDPVVTGATLYELLERGFQRGVPLQFSVGDSCGIENAPVGRTSMDIMRETGNFHYALKAALRFVLRRDEDASRRDSASAALSRLTALESGPSPVFFGSAADRGRTENEIREMEALAAPHVRCVDYDETGFIPVRTDLGAQGLAVWGTRDFHIARPWIEADHRVHVTRGCSTHLFAGWTGAVKGLVGLHALGLRPADQGMNERGQTALDFLSVMMHLSGYNAVVGIKGGVRELPDFGEAARKAAELWDRLKTSASLIPGWQRWIADTTALERSLRQDLKSGRAETDVIAEMRRRTRRILLDADAVSPGFRDALWTAVAEGTRVGLIEVSRMRTLLPEYMRDERMGLRIGLLAQAPKQAELVVQGLPKVGIGGGPDAYELVRDVGVVVAGTDEAAVDLVALEAAGIPGNPWAYNYPVHSAVQFGRAPAYYGEIRRLSV